MQEAMQAAQETMQAKVKLDSSSSSGFFLLIIPPSSMLCLRTRLAHHQHKSTHRIPNLSTPSTRTRGSSSNLTPGSPKSPKAPRATLSSAPPTVGPMTGTLTDKEREKFVYPGRVNFDHIHRPTRHLPAPTAIKRGPVICSRLPPTIKQRNAIAEHSGSYIIYGTLAIAMGDPYPNAKIELQSHREPPVSVPPKPAWLDPTKIVSFDPWGPLVPSVYRKESEELGLDIKPSIAVTKAHR